MLLTATSLALAAWMDAAAQSVPMRVERLDGWGTYNSYMGWSLEVTAGDLHPNFHFSPLPSNQQYRTLADDESDFLQIGGYYLFGPFEYESTYQQLYPWAVLVRGPGHGPGKNGHWRVLYGGGQIQATTYPGFGTGRSAWRAQGASVRLTVPQIVNRSSVRTTGTLQVYLMAHRSRAAVRSGRGTVVAVCRYGQLSPNYSYHARSTTVRMYRPPKGRVCTAMVLAEYTDRFTTREVRVFSKKVRFR